jgi:hypothetical protein
MNIEEQVGQKLHNLSLERQQEILDVVNSFAEKEASAKTLRNLRGLWRNSGFSLPKKTKLAVKCGATFRETFARDGSARQTNSKDKFGEILTGEIWSGRGESNPHLQLGKLTCCHCTTPAPGSA